MGPVHSTMGVVAWDIAAWMGPVHDTMGVVARDMAGPMLYTMGTSARRNTGALVGLVVDMMEQGTAARDTAALIGPVDHTVSIALAVVAAGPMRNHCHDYNSVLSTWSMVQICSIGDI